MKNRSRLTRYALLLLCGISMSILNAEQGSTSTWQKWKKPILATTMIASGIVGCLLLDYFLHTQFTHKLDSTTRGLVRGVPGGAFFNNNGELRQWPDLSPEQLKNQAIVDGQLYQNARFEDMVIPFSEMFRNVVDCVLDYRYMRFSYLLHSYLLHNERSFNMDVLLYQIGSKACFLTSLLGGYWLTQSEKEQNASDNTKDASKQL